jgi:hypothetical protein
MDVKYPREQTFQRSNGIEMGLYWYRHSVTKDVSNTNGYTTHQQHKETNFKSLKINASILRKGAITLVAFIV